MATRTWGVVWWLGIALVSTPALTGGCRGATGVASGLGTAVANATDEEAASYAAAEARLAAQDSDVRQKAAVQLLGMGHPKALAAVLERMTGSPDPAVRADMIEAAAFCVDHRCFAALVELLFGAFGEGLRVQAVPLLLEGLESRYLTVREAALKALKQISGLDLPAEREAWEEWWRANKDRTREDILEQRVWSLRHSLEASARRSEELEQQLVALSALLKLPESEAAGPLLEALGSHHRSVRDYAAFRLASLPAEALSSASLDERKTYETLREGLLDDDPELRERVVQCVIKLTGRFRTSLILQALEDKDPYVVLRAIDAVSKDMGEAAVERLSAVLGSPHAEVREAAANALGKLGSELAIEPLLGALDDPEENVRWFAVEGLRKLHAVAAVPHLCDLLAKDPNPRVREITATTLGELGQPAAVPALRNGLKDDNERVRASVVSALKALARGDFELMVIIADILAGEGHNGAAAEVLSKALGEFADQPELKDQLQAARLKLADVLKADKDFLAAAAAYAEADMLAGGDPNIRSQLVDCWLAGGEPGQILTAVEGWLDSAPQGGLAQVVDVGVEAARKLADGNEERLAEKLLTLLLEAARAAGDEALIQRLEQLGAAPAAPAAPE